MKLETDKITTPSGHVAWLVGAAATGFAASSVFSGLLHLSRNLFLLPYAVMAASFLYGYLRWSRIDLWRHFWDRPFLGLLGAALAGAFVISNVLSQPVSPTPEGWGLVFAAFWLGIVYGVLDALLLSVMPVVAAWFAFTQAGRMTTPRGRLLVAAGALAASLVVTAAYHLGYPEFRGPQVAGPLIGNAILTSAYLITRNPLSTTLAHVAMHVASVFHGMETTLQLPPHY